MKGLKMFRKNRKLLSIGSLAIVGVLAATLLSSCSKAAAPVVEMKTIRMGAAAGPPFLFRDATGGWTSFSAELARKFAEANNMKLEFVPTTWPTMVAGLQSNKYDFTQPVNATPERRLVVDFTSQISAAGSLFFIKAGAPYKTIEDLNSPSVTIAVISGSAEESVARKLVPKAKFRALPTATVADLATEVISGRSSTFIDSSYLAPAVDEKFGLTTIPSADSTPDGIEPVQIAFAVRKGDAALQTQLNDFIAKFTASGDLKKLADTWLTVENALKG